MNRHVIYSLLVIALQGCSSHEATNAPFAHELAQNRATLLSYEGTPYEGINILSAKSRDNVVELSLQIPSLTNEKLVNSEELIRQRYCHDRDIQKLLEAGVQYELNVFNIYTVPIMSLTITRDQCH